MAARNLAPGEGGGEEHIWEENVGLSHTRPLLRSGRVSWHRGSPVTRFLLFGIHLEPSGSSRNPETDKLRPAVSIIPTFQMRPTETLGQSYPKYPLRTITGWWQQPLGGRALEFALTFISSEVQTLV